MADRPRLSFTIGPVQAFVAQSRRTRDLWASSYLLSHLADVAMRAIENSGGEIVLPCREQAEDAVRPNAEAGTVYGRWPNRFVAEVNDGKAAAAAARQAIDKTWKRIADAVWKKCFDGKAPTQTQTIWNRQVGNFWETSWVVSPPGSAIRFDPLAQRKNWRTAPVTVEPGDHCTMMAEFQELSGFIRSKKRNDQDEFWKQLRDELGGLHLGNDERLCAIALIKRMFPTVAKEVVGTDLQAANWPSTPYIAAIPWLQETGASHAEAARRYAALITDPRKKIESPLGEKNTRIRSLSAIPNVGDFFQLDGNFFHETALANARDMPLRKVDKDDTSPRGERPAQNGTGRTADEEDDAKVRIKLLAELRKLYRTVQCRPSSFYALLLMDGDSMGALLSEAKEKSSNGEQDVTRALGRFADQVPGTVYEHDGVTVYCGGDDVLAMLPVPEALGCARALAEVYRQSFKETCGAEVAGQATISGAIVYCPFRTPFREVLQIAHHLLDDVAKDQTGRASLAVAVVKSGGLTAQWSAPWDAICGKDDKTLLCRLVERMRGTGERPDELSSSFLFQIRERFARLSDEPLIEPGQFGRLPAGIDLEALLRAEFERVRSCRVPVDEQAESSSSGNEDEEWLGLLTKLCRRIYRDNHRQTQIDELSLGMDGPLVLRFLASEGTGLAEEAPL